MKKHTIICLESVSRRDSTFPRTEYVKDLSLGEESLSRCDAFVRTQMPLVTVEKVLVEPTNRCYTEPISKSRGDSESNPRRFTLMFMSELRCIDKDVPINRVYVNHLFLYNRYLCLHRNQV